VPLVLLLPKAMLGLLCWSTLNVGLRIKETKEVYEGEVTELTAEEMDAPLSGYAKTISHVIIGLKTVKGTKQLKLDPTIYERYYYFCQLVVCHCCCLFNMPVVVSLQKEKVAVGDVIYIEANSGAVKRVGRSDAFATEFDLEAEEYVPLPKGDVHKKKEIIQDVTLHDLDVANARPQVPLVAACFSFVWLKRMLYERADKTSCR